MISSHTETELLLVIPAYNEAAGLRTAVERVREALGELGQRHLLVIAEDGSSDGTAELAGGLADEYDDLHVLSHARRIGRARALTRALQFRPAEVAAWMDADLATDLAHLPDLVGLARETRGAVVGSRLLPDSDCRRPATRYLLGMGYAATVRATLGCPVSDPQCGFAAYHRRFLDRVLPLATSTSWFWNTEILVFGAQLGLPITEIPVRWRETRPRDSRVRPTDVPGILLQVLRMSWQLRVGGP